MNIPLDHECFNWFWAVDKLDREEFHFAYKDGVFGYSYKSRPDEFYTWGVSKEDLEPLLSSWTKREPKEGFCGPMQPPPSKVILKIRQMEARRKHVQCGG